MIELVTSIHSALSPIMLRLFFVARLLRLTPQTPPFFLKFYPASLSYRPIIDMRWYKYMKKKKQRYGYEILSFGLI